MFEDAVGIVPEVCVVVLVSIVVDSFVVVCCVVVDSAGAVDFEHATRNPTVKIPKPIFINFFRLIFIIPF